MVLPAGQAAGTREIRVPVPSGQAGTVLRLSKARAVVPADRVRQAGRDRREVQVRRARAVLQAGS